MLVLRGRRRGRRAQRPADIGDAPLRLTCILSVVAMTAACAGPEADTPQASEPPQVEAALRGMYTHAGGPPLFTACGTGITYTVSEGGGAEDLDRAYRELQTGAGEPVLVGLNARLGTGEGGDGAAGELFVTSFETVFIGETCDGRPAGQPLEGPEWAARRVMGARTPADDPPTLTLDPEQGLIAWSGCTAFTGSYRLDGAQLRFTGVNPQPTPCGDPVAPGGAPGGPPVAMPSMARADQTFLQVLLGTGSYQLRGDTLELMGEGGVLAVFTWR